MRRDVLERWRGQNNRLLSLDGLLGDRIGTVLACTKFVRMGVQVGITGIGAALALDGTISPGAMIASSLLMSRALAPVEQAVGAWRTWSSALAAARRLRTALAGDAPAHPAVALPAPQGRLGVTNLVHRPAGCELPVLRGVSLTLEAGQALAIVGASGSGKSTLMRLLAGVLRPTSGEVRLDGADLCQWDSCDLGRHVGYLPQNVQLLNGTVAENISRFSAAPSSVGIIEAARLAGVHDLILRLPEGYGTAIGEGGHQLSGGQQQRIGLARALYGDPRLILLDEPNSNLDPEGEAALVEALHACREAGRTVVLVSHRAALLRFVDWIVVLREGRVERAGARGDLMRTFATPASEAESVTTPMARAIR
jgi:PrtD family type I secretion system ABC transporter